jgi:nitrogen fixation/metabolism regulation signal transduction histidine kinase
MIFKNFRFQVVWRSLLLTVSTGSSVYFFLQGQVTAGLLGILVTSVMVFQLIRIMESTNRKLTFFLESIENSDFTVKFSRDNKSGKGFKELNRAFNHVFDAFREIRAEKEAHLQYLHTVVQYVRIGLISFDRQGKVELFNNAAVKLLGTVFIRNISQLNATNPELLEILHNIEPGENAMLRKYLNNAELQLSISATELQLRGTAFKLVSITNIHDELQQKEIEAWQNLAKVLRHEIMNSITPIVSHVETLNEIISDKMSWTSEGVLTPETTTDLTKALRTIEKRSKGLLHFVDAYRNFSEIPTPEFRMVKVRDLFDRLSGLFQGETKKMNILVNAQVKPKGLQIRLDQELIDTVLINLFKNALEAVRTVKSPMIELNASLDDQAHAIIEIRDNGPGIIPEAQDKLFIPFYTTKDGGSGIGLSLSRQIMLMHHGNLTVKSEPEKHTVFTLHF